MLASFPTPSSAGRTVFLSFVLSMSAHLAVAAPAEPAAGETLRRFHIPPSPAETALELFSDQAGVQVLFLIEDVEGVSTKRLEGAHPPRPALERLLRGTPLSFRHNTATGDFAVFRPGRAGRRASGRSVSETTDSNPTTHSTPSMKFTKPRSFLSGLVAFVASQVSAQTPATESEGVVQLTPFEVSSAGDSGYVVSESMSGARIATKIIDLPYSIGVITSEFFDDFALFELGDNLAYISSFSDLDQGGSFNLRGIRGTVQLRDGFFRLGRYGSSNIDRVEVIKGPSAAIYGATSPGGMVNMVSKKPRKTNSQKLSLSVGTFDTTRATLELNGAIGKDRKTSYVGIFGFYDTDTDTPLERLTNREAYLAVQHDFSESSNLLVQLEYFLSERQAPGSAAPLLLDDRGTSSTADDQIVGIADKLTNLQQTGPLAYLNRGMRALTGTYSKRFTQHISLRVSGNLYHAENENYANVSVGTLNQRTRIIARNNQPEFGRIYEDGGGIQADLLADYRIGAIGHRTLFTIDFNDYYRNDPADRVTGPDLTAWSAVRNLLVNADLTGPEGTPQYITTRFNPASSTRRRYNKNRTSVLGVLVRQQVSLMDSRLLLFGGGRVDHTKYSLRNLQPAVPESARFDFDEVTFNLGANYKLTPNLRVFANYSEGFNPNAQTITASSINPDYQSETSQGLDYGIKASFLDERLNFTLIGFRVKRQNVVVQDIDPDTLLQVTRFEGSQLMEGVEFDASWKFNDELSFTTSFGYIDSKITDLGFRTRSIGRSPARIQPVSASFTARYVPKAGFLEGFSSNLGVIYAGRTPISAPDAGDVYTNGVFVRSTGEWRLEVPSYVVLNAGLRYTLQRGKDAKLRHTFGVNVNNLLDDDYLKSNRRSGDRRSVFFNYTILH